MVVVEPSVDQKREDDAKWRPYIPLEVIIFFVIIRAYGVLIIFRVAVLQGVAGARIVDSFNNFTYVLGCWT